LSILYGIITEIRHTKKMKELEEKGLSEQ